MGVGAPRHRMETAWLHGDGSARLQAAAFARARCASHRLQARCAAAGVAHSQRQPALALRHSLAAAARQAHPRRAPAARAAALLHAPRAGHQQRAGVWHGGRPPAGPLAPSQPPPLPAPPLRRSPPCTGDVTAPTRTAGAPPPGAAGCQRCRAESRVTAISAAAAPNRQPRAWPSCLSSCCTTPAAACASACTLRARGSRRRAERYRRACGKAGLRKRSLHWHPAGGGLLSAAQEILCAARRTHAHLASCAAASLRSLSSCSSRSCRAARSGAGAESSCGAW